MKKLLGLLAICSLVACNDSSESVAAPQWGNGGNTAQQGGDDQGQDTRTPEQIADSIAQHVADSIAALYGQQNLSSSVMGLSSATFGLSSSSMVLASSSSMVGVSSSSLALSSATTPVRSSSSKTTPKSSATIPDDEDEGLFKLTLWDGAAGDPHVLTGNKTGGWWYSYADDLGSEITWGGTVGDDGDMTEVIAACGGVCGDYVIGAGDPDEGVYPYLGFAFGYAKSANTTGDATAMKGICVTYTYSGTATFAVEMGLTTSQENKLGSALPMAELAKGTKKTVDLLWTDFVQPDWAKTTMTGKAAAAQLSSIKFKFADATGGESGSFNIIKVGPYGGCD